MDEYCSMAVCCVLYTSDSLSISLFSFIRCLSTSSICYICWSCVWVCVCGTWLHDLPYRAKTNQTYAQNTTTTTATTANGEHNGERVKTWSFQHWNIYSYYIYKASNSWCGHVNCKFALSLTERKHTHGRAPHPHTCSLQLHAQHNTHRDSPNWLREKHPSDSYCFTHIFMNPWRDPWTIRMFKRTLLRSALKAKSPWKRSAMSEEKTTLSHTNTSNVCGNMSPWLLSVVPYYSPENR